ncbi:MAG: hypothetical protein NTU63_01895 [Candidatus Pacearchaeota archaeon]|nr:hypothetical protein [Candidatus Pacearchaeota archaeon]
MEKDVYNNFEQNPPWVKIILSEVNKKEGQKKKQTPQANNNDNSVK